MDEIKGAGWTRFKPVDGQPMSEQDLKKVFKMVDMDGSGAISQLVGFVHVVFVHIRESNLIFASFQELKMAVKYLGKRYGISDVNNLSNLLIKSIS